MKLRLVDSHCHIDGSEFDADRQEVLARARAAGVERMVVVGTGQTLEDIARPLALAAAEPDIFATVGVHPHDASRIEPGWWERLEEMLGQPKVVAVGETGLDYHYDHSPRDVQVEAFRRHVRLARKVGKPVVCHVRDAHPDSLRVLEEENAAEVGAVIHCFTGTPEDARAYVAAGFDVSFSGIVTFKNAEPIRQAVREVPLDRIHVETDAPFLAPVPHRGKRNEPAFVAHTAEVVARAAGLSPDELAAAASANTSRLFRLTGTP